MSLITDKSLFIHIQKTGGMTVRHGMYLCDGNVRESGKVEVERHYGLPELRVAHPGIEATRLTFGFVRNPVDWLTSRWLFAVKSGFEIQRKHRPTASMIWLSDCWDTDFSSFVDKYLERYPGVITQEMFRRLGVWTEKPVERVGRVETLIKDLVSILHQAGEVFSVSRIWDLEKYNASGRSGISMTTQKKARVLDAERGLVDAYYPDS